MSDTALAHAEAKMRAAGESDVAIAAFRHYYRQLEAGETGLMPEADLDPVEDLPNFEDLPDDHGAQRAALEKTVVIKLNGGLGTSMGMDRAKALLPVRDGQSFLDVITRQILALRAAHDVRLPLLLMHSFYTRADSLAALKKHPDLDVGVPLDFVQSREPKLTADALEPVEWPPNPDLEWCPPGHGDLYPSILASGVLEQLLDGGYEYAFVSNADNLGAVLDPRILAWFAGGGAPFALESAERTSADRKGGHIAIRRADGRLVLRESAQTPDDDAAAFSDTSRHRFFNTNNLWLSLPALAAALEERDGVLGLPLIRNQKTVDPSDKSSPPVVQIETAMGAAVGVFDGAQALHVPRERFAPVKTTDDLLVLRSDAYRTLDDGRVVPAGPLPLAELDPDHFKLIRDFDAHFPHGAPSLRECRRLTVHGDVTFGRDVVVRGEVTIEGPRRVEDGEVLEG